MKFADFVILAIIFIAIVLALWYNHKRKGSCCCGDCNRCSRICGDKTNNRKESEQK